MDGARFDEMAVMVALSGHRRTVLRALGAGVTALLVGHPNAAAGPPLCQAPGQRCARSGECCATKCKTRKGKKKGKCAKCPSRRPRYCSVDGGPPPACCASDRSCCGIGDIAACCPNDNVCCPSSPVPQFSCCPNDHPVCCPNGSAAGCCQAGAACCPAGSANLCDTGGGCN